MIILSFHVLNLLSLCVSSLIRNQTWIDGMEIPAWAAASRPAVTWSAPAAQGPGTSALWTVMIVDPDAPSWADPKLRHWLHWLVVDVQGVCNSTTCRLDESCDPDRRGITIASYMGPSPPRNSGPHRSVAPA